LWGVYYHLPGRRHEGTTLIERSLALCRDVGDREGIAASLDCLGMMARERGDDAQAETLHQESLTLYRALDDPDGMASALGELGYLLTGQGDYERAGALLDEALALCRQQQNAMGVAHILWLLGRVRDALEDYPAAIACFTESAETARVIGVRQQVLNALGSLGLVAERQKEYETAFQRYNDCLVVAAEVSDDWNCANYRWRMGWIAIHLRRYGHARTLFGQGLSSLQPDQHTPMILACLEGVAYTAAGEQKPERAARLFGAVEALGTNDGHPPTLTSGDAFRESTVAKIRAALGEPSFSDAWAVGRNFTMPQAIHYAQGGSLPATSR
jgi:tetratricopeptide (TPR) repeat protein